MPFLAATALQRFSWQPPPLPGRGLGTGLRKLVDWQLPPCLVPKQPHLPFLAHWPLGSAGQTAKLHARSGLVVNHRYCYQNQSLWKQVE